MMKIMQSEYRGGTGKRVLPKSWVSIIFLHHSASDGEKAYFHDWFFVCLFVCFCTACLPVYPPLDSQSKSIARTYTKLLINVVGLFEVGMKWPYL